MRDRYPITGITQSYRSEKEVRTLVMPVLIFAVLAGLGAFYFLGKGDPSNTTDSLAENVPTSPEDAPPIVALPVTESLSPTDSSSDLEPVALVLPGDGTRGEPNSGGFTPWMSPLALDTYIRTKNAGFSESFWKRGHWITAVEGRWVDGTHEFRISYGKIPDRNTWQWQYRVNQKPEEFSRTALELRAQGFKMVQSQSFDHPDSTKRFQAVWQKRVAPAQVAEVSPHPAWEREETTRTESGIAIPPPTEGSTPESTAATLKEQAGQSRFFGPAPTGPTATPNSSPEQSPIRTRAFDVNNLQFR